MILPALYNECLSNTYVQVPIQCLFKGLAGDLSDGQIPACALAGERRCTQAVDGANLVALPLSVPVMLPYLRQSAMSTWHGDCSVLCRFFCGYSCSRLPVV